MMKVTRQQLARMFCVLVLALPTLAHAEAPSKPALLSQAESLMQQGDYQAAYTMLASAEPDYAGDMAFDLLLGTAAMETKHYTNSMFAFERVLAVEPNHALARERIAQAHLYLGEVDSSKQEFKQLLSYNPSTATAKAIEKYLSAIDKAMGLSSVYTAYLDVGAGWDSNVNSATSANNIAVPLFGGFNFTLADEARKKSDHFLSVGAGAGFTIPATASVAYIGNLQLAKKLNHEHQAFETGNIDLNLGVQFKRDQDVITLAAQDGHFYVDDAHFRHSYGASAQWQRNIDARNQASIYGQYAKLNYLDNEIRNADRYVLGANYAHAFDWPTSPIVFVGAYLAQEDATQKGTQFLDQDIYGLRAGGQLVVAPRWVAYASAGYESRAHQADDVAFLKKRNDDQYDFTLGVQYIPARYWTIKPQINLMKNDSNIELNAFERASMTINIRREFDW